MQSNADANEDNRNRKQKPGFAWLLRDALLSIGIQYLTPEHIRLAKIKQHQADPHIVMSPAIIIYYRLFHILITFTFLIVCIDCCVLESSI